MTRHARTRGTTVKALLVATATAVIAPLGLVGAGAALAAPASTPDGYNPVVAETSATELVEAVPSLDRAEAMRRLASQPARVALGERLLDKIGADAAGMWLDQRADTVVVNVTSTVAAATVRAAGAEARLVQHSMADLEAVRDALTKSQPTDTAVGIDVKANQVVVQVGEHAAGTARLADQLAVAESYGTAVRVKHIDGSFGVAISGGYPIVGSGGGRCSLGFNTTANTGITAGHCTQGIPQWWEGCCGGGYYGPSIHYYFPGRDFGLIRNDGGLAQPGDVYLYNGGFQDIGNATDPYYGLAVCKSGSTTGLTCGHVYATGVTICYPQGCVGNLAQSNAYAQPGDSGGPWFNGGWGIGLTSGIGGGWTFFQPLVEALNYHGIWVY